MTTHKRIDVAKLAELIDACRRVAELPFLQRTADARRARDKLRLAVDKITELIAESVDCAD